jgi:transposase InsO family protein
VNRTVREWLTELEEQNPVEEPTHSQDKVSTTDPDSTYATTGGTPSRMGYYNNYLVDNHSCIIVGVQATGARLSEESRAAEEMIARFTRWQGKNPHSIAADASYGNGELLQWLMDRQITPYMPHARCCGSDNPAAKVESISYNNQNVSEFVEVWPVLRDFWEQEFKFSTTPPIKFRFPEKADAESSLLVAARFGLYANEDSYEFLRERFAATSFTYDATFKSEMVGGGALTPIRATELHCFQQRQFVHSHAYFLLDPENAFDVIDYWNLRAAGMSLVALTLADYKDFEPLVREFGAAAAYPINEQVTNHVTLIKGRSITEDEVTLVAEWIRFLGFLKEFSTMGWVPRFNMNYYGVGNEIDVRRSRLSNRPL